MQNLTEKEKEIYNKYLYFSRFGKPVKLRKDFSDMDPNTVSLVKKLAALFNRYPQIMMDDFFKAPIHIYADESYPQLSFFTTMAAIKTYTVFKNKQEDEDPEKQFDRIKESFRFIGMFCLENKISLEDYPRHKTAYIYSWMNHYKEHKISPYSLMEIPNIFSVLSELPKDEVEIFTRNLNEKLVTFKTRYMNSKKTKDLVREATRKIDFFIKNNLH